MTEKKGGIHVSSCIVYVTVGLVVRLMEPLLRNMNKYVLTKCDSLHSFFVNIKRTLDRCSLTL